MNIVTKMPEHLGRRRWPELWEQLQCMMMLGLWVANLMLRLPLLFMPHYFSTSPIIKALENLISQSQSFYEQEEARDESLNDDRGEFDQHAIGRALSQVLGLMNDMPASSQKYGFVRSLAEKILSENHAHGGSTLIQINRFTLETDFARTIYLLTLFLDNQQQQQHVQAFNWPLCALKGLTVGTLLLSLPFLPLLTGLKKGANLISQIMLPQHQVSAQLPSHSYSYDNGETAEKLALELLWLAQKLNEFSTVEGAMLQWSSASYLANLSLHANPRVQRALVKLSGFLCSGMASSARKISSEVTLKLLVLWLPLLCTANNGVDGAIFNASERDEGERLLERAIEMLTAAEQETVLAVWLREFTGSSSNWPNLQLCYDSWCHETRKLSDPLAVCDKEPK